MESVFFYIIKSSLSIILFYIFFILFLRKETSFNWNRIYILSAGIISILAPMFSFSSITPEYIYVIRDIYVTPAKSLTEQLYKSFYTLNPISLLSTIYLTGAGIFSIFLIIGFAKLFRIYYSATKSYLLNTDVLIIKSGTSPFSFFSTIFVPLNYTKDPNLDKILLHEKMHARNFHSLDILFFEIICILQWFNPFVWLLKNELQAQHEFIADNDVLDKGLCSSAYKKLLFSYTFEIPGINITNSFNSLLKRRFEMLSINKNSLYGKLKAVLSIPLFLTVFFLWSSVNSAGMIPISPSMQDDGKIYEKVDVFPVFPGGDEALINYISSNLEYPASAKEAGIQGRVLVKMIIEKDGRMTNAQILKGIPELNDAALAVFSSMPKWTPGKKDGKSVRVAIIIPLTFKLQ